MDNNNEEFLKKLLSMFKIEAREHLEVISSGLSELGKNDPKKLSTIIETVYRESHSLKGAARSVNMAGIVSLCQSMENVFSSIKSGNIPPSPHIIDLLHQAVDGIDKLVSEEKISVPEKTFFAELICNLEKTIAETGENEQETTAKQESEDILTGQNSEEHRQQMHSDLPSFINNAAPALNDTVRIATTKLTAILLQTEEMLSIKLSAAQRVSELKEIKIYFDQWKKRNEKKVQHHGKHYLPDTSEQDTSDPLISIAERELLTGNDDVFISSMETGLTTLLKTAEYDHRSVRTMVDNLLDTMKKTLMLPLSALLEIFPVFVRDLSRDTGKKVELVTGGGDIEIDRRIMEEMKDPLLHLVRNCVDHGIEIPDERKRKNKSDCGHVKINIASRDNKIEIRVSDDGAGINAAKVKNSAVKRGLISQEEADNLSEKETLLLVFKSGVTTSPIITDISGRGLGLAIVGEKIESLNGTVAIDTLPDIGTTFKIVIPVTLATFRGLLVKADDRLYVIPSMNIERVERIRKDEIRTIENREVLSIDGHVLSFARLENVLELKTGNSRMRSDVSTIQVIIISSAENRMAFMVDEILNEQEILLKPLGRQLSRVRNISAATVLGNGKVVPILNVSDLIKSAIKKAQAPSSENFKETTNSKSILVVEDSITARTLLKNILDSAGYNVETAVDGIDALTVLRTGKIDLVVSDIEMPKMNGFDLTAKIRANKKFSELPVVLVTALESRKDKEKGVDAGANAYIVKSTFEQSNLLEVIRELI
jgi:two-component system, chemotaxis family, sensor kinase CheA